MTTLADAAEFLAELISQLFHADMLITEPADRCPLHVAAVVRGGGGVAPRMVGAGGSAGIGTERK